MKMKTAAFLALAAIVILTGCNADNTSKSTQLNLIDDTANRPDSEVRNARIYLYDKGRVTTEIFSTEIHKFDELDSTMGYQLDIDFFDSTGVVMSEVIGDSGIIREQSGQLSIYGNVVVITEDKTKLETDYLYWNTVTDKIYTDAFVRITSEDGVLTGWGLEADQRLSSYQILSRVSGTADKVDPDLK
ncbi:MAG: LPS export ABC transporter periplasmic protein LptC [Candidatus Zixiibacteriota bacterium]